MSDPNWRSDDELVSDRELAKTIKTSVRTVQRYEQQGIIPPAHRFGPRLKRHNKRRVIEALLAQPAGGDEPQAT